MLVDHKHVLSSIVGLKKDVTGRLFCRRTTLTSNIVHLHRTTECLPSNIEEVVQLCKNSGEPGISHIGTYLQCSSNSFKNVQVEPQRDTALSKMLKYVKLGWPTCNANNEFLNLLPTFKSENWRGGFKAAKSWKRDQNVVKNMLSFSAFEVFPFLNYVAFFEFLLRQKAEERSTEISHICFAVFNVVQFIYDWRDVRKGSARRPAPDSCLSGLCDRRLLNALIVFCRTLSLYKLNLI